jgi:UDP-2,4-diacetamido-2,4,6-trideoxy-beta-L-altropyranose hydrolase
MRCLSLAEGLKKKDWQCFFVTKDYDARLTDKIKEKGFEVRLIPNESSLKEDLELTRKYTSQLEAGIILTDSYGIDREYLKTLKEDQFFVLSIDDSAQTHFYSDILLNQNIHAIAREYRERIEPYTKLLLGPKYALLREDFVSNRKAALISEKVEKVLVTMGGGDPYNQSLKVLRALDSMEEAFSITVLLGSSFLFQEEIENFTSSASRKITIVQNTNQVARLMEESDLAISAAGCTVWELCCLGVPTILLILADNQEPIAKSLQKKGIMNNLGWFNQVDESHIQQEVFNLLADQKLRQEMADKGHLLVDGLGVERIVKEIEEGLKNEENKNQK